MTDLQLPQIWVRFENVTAQVDVPKKQAEGARKFPCPQRQQKETFTILNSISGAIRPGTLTLVSCSVWQRGAAGEALRTRVKKGRPLRHWFLHIPSESTSPSSRLRIISRSALLHRRLPGLPDGGRRQSRNTVWPHAFLRGRPFWLQGASGKSPAGSLTAPDALILGVPSSPVCISSL